MDTVKQEISIRTGVGDIKASIDNDHNFYIGTLFNASRGFFAGSVDELRVYGKLLSEGEIQTNFASKGLAVISSIDKLSCTWGKIKTSR